MNGALAMVNNVGSPKVFLGPRHQGAFFLRTFFLGMQKEGTRRSKAKYYLTISNNLEDD